MADEEDDYADDTFDDYDDDDFEDDEEDEPAKPEPAKAAAPAAPAPVTAAAPRQPVPAPPVRDIPVNPASKVTQEELVRLSILAENQRSKLADRDGNHSGSDHGSRPGSGSVSSRRPSVVHHNDRSRRDSGTEQLPERRSMGLPSAEHLKSDVDPEVKRKAAIARLARWKAITSVVQMKQVAIDDVFSLAPLTLLELSHVGRGNFFDTLSRGTQTQDDSCTVEIQTEHVDMRTVKAQCPEDIGLSREALERQSDSSKRKVRALPGWTSTAGALQGDGSSARRLNRFVSHVGPIVEALLNERVKKQGTIFGGVKSSKHGESLSAGALTLTAAAARGRTVTGAAFASSSPRGGSSPLLLTTLAAADASVQAHGPEARGVALVWNLADPSKPLHHLVSQGSPTCCCWSPGQPFCAIAGMEEGGICLWDLREAAEEHPTENGVTWRRQTYSTEASCDFDDILGPIRALAVTKATAAASTEAASARFSFQMVSLDAWANVVVWLVTEMSSAAGADADFGMRIGGKVKMLRTNVVGAYGPAVPTPLVMPAAGLGAVKEKQAPGSEKAVLVGVASRVRQTFHLAILPTAPNEFVVAGDQGMLLRGTRFGVTPVPRQYALSDPVLGERFQSRYLRSCVAVAPSPFFPAFFTAAYCPSTVALYTVDVGLALLCWRDFTPADIIALKWSPVKPSLLFALDAHSTMFAFDLLEGTPNAPLFSESFAGASGARATSMDVSVSSAAMADASSRGGSTSSGSDPTEHAFVLTYSDGSVAVHRFHPRFAPDGAGDPSHAFHRQTKHLLSSMHAEGVAAQR